MEPRHATQSIANLSSTLVMGSRRRCREIQPSADRHQWQIYSRRKLSRPTTSSLSPNRQRNFPDSRRPRSRFCLPQPLARLRLGFKFAPSPDCGIGRPGLHRNAPLPNLDPVFWQVDTIAGGNTAVRQKITAQGVYAAPIGSPGRRNRHHHSDFPAVSRQTMSVTVNVTFGNRV